MERERNDLSALLAPARGSARELADADGPLELQPLPKRRAAKLRSENVSPVGCATAALVAVTLTALVSNALLRRFDSPARWLVPVALVAVALLWMARRVRFAQARIQRDLERGTMTVRCVEIVDAIEIAEQEDEGPSYFLMTRGGTTLFLTGQYLEGYRRRGFPWTSFEIREAPESGEFLGFRCTGARLVPLRMRALTGAERRAFGNPTKNYQAVAIDFAALRQAAAAQESAHSHRG